MQTSDESELKYRLPSVEAFGKVRSRLESGGNPVRQTNEYYDARDLRLTRSGIMVRVRRESPLARSGEARIHLTIKSGGIETAGFFRSTEQTMRLTFAEWRTIHRDPDSFWALQDPAIAALAERFGRPELEAIGTLSTDRSTFRLEEGLVLELDRVIFPDGHEEYEIEIETEAPDWAAAQLAALLSEIGVTAEPETRTKLERLIERLRGSVGSGGAGGGEAT